MEWNETGINWCTVQTRTPTHQCTGELTLYNLLQLKSRKWVVGVTTRSVPCFLPPQVFHTVMESKPEKNIKQNEKKWNWNLLMHSTDVNANSSMYRRAYLKSCTYRKDKTSIQHMKHSNYLLVSLLVLPTLCLLHLHTTTISGLSHLECTLSLGEEENGYILATNTKQAAADSTNGCVNIWWARAAVGSAMRY